MKKLLFFAAAALITVPLFGTQPRIDISSQKKFKLTPAAQKTVLTAVPAPWQKEYKEFYITTANAPKLTSEWTKISCAFVPEKDGRVWISFLGAWRKNVADRKFVRYSDIKINGKLVKNGNMTAYKHNKKLNKLTADYFWSDRKGTRFFPNAGPDGKSGAIEVNHDNNTLYAIQVKGGETYVVEAMVQAAPAAGK